MDPGLAGLVEQLTAVLQEGGVSWQRGVTGGRSLLLALSAGIDTDRVGYRRDMPPGQPYCSTMAETHHQ